MFTSDNNKTFNQTQLDGLSANCQSQQLTNFSYSFVQEELKFHCKHG